MVPFRSTNPFDQDFAARLDGYESAKSLLSQWVRSVGDEEADKAMHLNVLVLSAILHGGLLSSASVAALLRSVPEMTKRTLVVAGKLHVELLLSWNGFANSELRRWQPDALTSMLWARLSPDAANDYLAPEMARDHEKDPSDVTILKRFKKQFHLALQRERSFRLRSLESLLSASYVVAHTQIPPIIVRYASREIISHSPTRTTLGRFFRTELPPADCAPTETAPKQKGGAGFRSRHERSQDPLWLQSLLATIERSSARSELEAIRNGAEERRIKTFADFALWLQSVSSPSGSKYKVQATVNMVGLLGRYLEPFLENVDPVGHDSEAMTELYFQAMEATGPASSNLRIKGDLARALREFDRYLAGCCDSYSGSGARFPWFPTGLAEVDANPASHEDYSRLLRRIEQEWPADEPELRTIAWLLVMLGFRCGLRRMEALYLQVQDVLVRGRGELIVRPTPLRSLKSENAERRIPIGIFLTKDEMEKLRRWKEDRLANPTIGPTDCLFGLAEIGMNPVSEKIFNRINVLMRRGDSSDTGEEHFHELRHGFATWTFLAVMLSDLKEVPVLFPELPETTAWLSKCREVKTALFRHSYPTRKYAYMLARLLGHASPGTTLENYVHCSDFLLSLFLSESEMMRPDSTLVGKFCGQADTTWRSWVQNGGLSAIPVRLWERRIRALGLGSEKRNRALKTTRSVPESSHWAEHIWEYLYRSETGHEDPEELLRRFHLEEDIAVSVRARAKYVAGLRLYPNQYRHEMELWTPNLARPNEQIRLNCPRRPRSWRGLLITNLANALSKMNNRPHLRSLMQGGLRYCVCNVDRNHYVRFRDVSHARDAQQFIHLLHQLGISGKTLRLISGDTSEISNYRREWKRALQAQVETRPRGGDYGPNSAISIRAGGQFIGGTRINHSAFSFLLVLAFIAFGEIPE